MATTETRPARIRGRLIDQVRFEERRVEAAGIASAVIEGGEGPPLVLLHGPGEFALTWLRVLEELAVSHRVIAPDLPGHGETEWPAGKVDGDRVLAWLADVVDATCDEPPVIAGHLLGGAIAARFAARYPDRLSRLILVDTFGLGLLRPAPRFAFAMARFVIRPTEGTQRGLMTACMADIDSLRQDMDGDLERLEAYALAKAQGADLKAALRTLMPKVGVPAIPTADLESIRVPTTLIWGRHDLQVNVRTAERASAHYGWPLHIVEGAADDPAVEQPVDFMKAMRTALA